MIAIEIVIVDVRHAEESGKYILAMTIDGVREQFTFGDSSVSRNSLSYDAKYERIFSGLAGSKQIGRFVLDFRAGNMLGLPQVIYVYRLAEGEKPPPFH